MYGPSGMLLALALLGASPDNTSELAAEFKDSTRTPDSAKAKEAMTLAFAGMDSTTLNRCLCQAFRTKEDTKEFPSYRKSALTETPLPRRSRLTITATKTRCYDTPVFGI